MTEGAVNCFTNRWQAKLYEYNPRDIVRKENISYTMERVSNSIRMDISGEAKRGGY